MSKPEICLICGRKLSYNVDDPWHMVCFQHGPLYNDAQALAAQIRREPYWKESMQRR